MRSTILFSGLSLLRLSATAAVSHRNHVEARQSNPGDPYADWPSYSDLPLDESYPTKAAWGVWGDDDVAGALNHITPATIQEAASEIQSGLAFNLNLELTFIPRPTTPERRPLIHLFQPAERWTDDVVTMNTQISTQYDGLRHFAYSEDANTSNWKYYNNLITEYEEQVLGYDHTDVLGIQQAAEKGIAARGVLLDYKAWMDSQNRTFNPLENYPVDVSELQEVAEWQGLTGNWSRPGDILIIRWGWIEAFAQLNATEKEALILRPAAYIGLTPTDEAAEWLWDHKFALVGGDNPAFEEQPFNSTIAGTTRSLHEILLAGWGTSILEFVDCEGLAPALRAANRSTFFLTVQTLNVRGGIASPPNAMAII